MDVILGWLPRKDDAFLFHRPVNWGEAGGHRSKLKAVLVLRCKFSSYSFYANIAENYIN